MGEDKVSDQPNTTPSETAKKLAATIVKRASEGVRRELGVNAEFKPVGLETLIDLYLDEAGREERVAERARCTAIARNGANFFRDKPIKFVAPEKYAADLADDIADAIEKGDAP